MLDKLLKAIKKNKILIIFLSILILCFIFCSFNTFIINDDLPYSFFHRTNVRITNIRQILLNQITDYKNISPRIFVHCIVQFLLIYNKTLWSIINPIIIVLTFLFMYKIIKINIKDNNWHLPLLIIISLYLTLVKYKRIIYWVAGSVNYVWTGLYLFILLYLYLKYGYSKKKYINILAILSVSILHEYLLIFCIIFIFINYFIKVIQNKKIINEELIYFIPLIISGIFLLKSPSLIGRVELNNEWSGLSLIARLSKSLPVVSYNFLNYKNIVSFFYIIILIIGIYNSKIKYKNYFSIILIVISILSYITGNGWLYLFLALIMFINTIYYLYNSKNEKLITIFISMYGIVYSMAMVSEYDNIRANYIVYLFLIILSVIILYDLNCNKKYLLFLFMIIFAFLVFKEMYSYFEIGNISRERISNINKCIKDNCHILKLKEIPKKYDYYHMDINSPGDNTYFAYKEFLNYYHLHDDIVIKYYK